MTVFYIVLLASWRFVRVCGSTVPWKLVITPPRRACLSVCVFVCPRSYLWNYMSDFHPIFVRVTFGRSSVLLRRRSDTLCTSGFIDDVMVAHKLRLLDVS